jgi:hypothetical protein
MDAATDQLTVNTKTILYLIGGGVLLWIAYQGYKSLTAGIQAVGTVQPGSSLPPGVASLK